MLHTVVSPRPFAMLSRPQGPALELLQAAPPLLPLPSTQYTLSAMYRTAMPALALDFTQSGRGLLITDAGNYVTMLQLVPKDTLALPAAAGGGSRAAGGIGASASSRMADVPARSQLHQQQQQQHYQQQQQGGLVSLAVHEAWRVRADAAHTLAAASIDCYSTCATTAAAAGGGGGPHKVTIWWPSSPGAAPGQGPGASGSQHHVQQELFSVGAEVVRHPVRVLSLEWSPPLAGGGARPTREAPSPGGPGGSAPLAAAAGKAGAAGASAAGPGAGPTPPSSALAAAPPTPSMAPALMTLGADWVIRIYVEVVMQNMGAAGAAGQPNTSINQFCLTLVIEPPGLTLAPSSRPGMRACWARPLGGAGVAGAAGGVPGALPEPGGAGADGKEAGTGEAGAGPGAEGGGEAGGPEGAAAGAGSRLQWIVASVGAVSHDDADMAAHGEVLSVARILRGLGD